MRHNEVRIVILNISRSNREHESGETANREQEHEAQREQHWRLESHCATPHCREPIEYFYAGWNRNQHRRKHEEHLSGQRHANRKHVMRPYDERKEGDA
jgi:hypothetical protein